MDWGRRWLPAITLSGTLLVAASCQAGHPSESVALQFGRWIGYGWGDGYGARPLPPPRLYVPRWGQPAPTTYVAPQPPNVAPSMAVPESPSEFELLPDPPPLAKHLPSPSLPAGLASSRFVSTSPHAAGPWGRSWLGPAEAPTVSVTLPEGIRGTGDWPRLWTHQPPIQDIRPFALPNVDPDALTYPSFHQRLRHRLVGHPLP